MHLPSDTRYDANSEIKSIPTNSEWHTKCWLVGTELTSSENVAIQDYVVPCAVRTQSSKFSLRYNHHVRYTTTQIECTVKSCFGMAHALVHVFVCCDTNNFCFLVFSHYHYHHRRHRPGLQLLPAECIAAREVVDGRRVCTVLPVGTSIL